MGLQGGRAVLIGVEEEELHLRSDVDPVAHFGGVIHGPPQHVTGIAAERLPLRGVDVADEPGRAVVALFPGEDAPGAEIGVEIHVALLHPDEAVDGRAVEAHFVVKGLFQLAGGDGDILHHAHDVGELQQDEADLMLFRFA